MEISPSQIVNAGIYTLDERRRKAHELYSKAVKDALFLSSEQKSRWNVLSYLLTTEQLMEAQDLITKENLKALKISQKLDTLKTKEK